MYHSRNLALVKLLIEKGVNTGVYDELLTKDEINKLGLTYIQLKDADIIFDTFNLHLSTNK